MPYVVGHRGAAGVLPENTIKGFQHAIDLGVAYVECDVHHTFDRKLVVIHDETIDRTTNGTGAVRSLEFSTVRRLDAGDGLQIPTLDEVLETTKNKVTLLCELKGEGTEEEAAATVTAHDMVQEVIFTCFDMERLARLRRLGDHYRLGVNLRNADAETLAQARDLGACTAGVYYKNLSFHGVELFQNAGLDIRGWNPDTLRQQKAIIALGVDGVSTNRPDILLNYLNNSRED